MSKLFSLDEIKQTPVAIDKSELEVTRFLDAQQHKIGGVKELLNRLPAPGEAFFLWTVNQFNAFTFIPYLIDNTKCIDDLMISTYSINIRIIDSLSSFVQKNLVGNVYILISDSAKFRIPAVIDHLEQFRISFPNVTVRYAWNHSKITLMRCDDQFYVIEGSGNFSENSRHKQYIFLNSKHIYEFRRRWIVDEIHGRTT